MKSKPSNIQIQSWRACFGGRRVGSLVEVYSLTTGVLIVSSNEAKKWRPEVILWQTSYDIILVISYSLLDKYTMLQWHSMTEEESVSITESTDYWRENVIPLCQYLSMQLNLMTWFVADDDMTVT